MQTLRTIPELNRETAQALATSSSGFTVLYWRKPTRGESAVPVHSFKTFKSLGLAESEFASEASRMEFGRGEYMYMELREGAFEHGKPLPGRVLLKYDIRKFHEISRAEQKEREALVRKYAKPVEEALKARGFIVGSGCMSDFRDAQDGTSFFTLDEEGKRGEVVYLNSTTLPALIEQLLD